MQYLKRLLIILISVGFLTFLLVCCKKKVKPDASSSPSINESGSDTVKPGTGTDTMKAGTDQTVYLSQTANLMLAGSSSPGNSYQWSKIYDVQPPQAGHPIDPAIITSPSSATTTVTGLIQGVWYYQLAVKNGGTTKYDTTVVRVDYDVPPAGGTYLRSLEMTNPIVYNYINDRTDTSQITGSPVGFTTTEGDYFPDRARSNSMMIDSSRGKFYSTIEDGYGWESNRSYARSEMSYGSYYTLDSNKTYVLEWKGYFPQDFSYLMENQTVGGIMQVHPNNDGSPPFGITILNGYDGSNHSRGAARVRGLYFIDNGVFTLIEYLDSMVNKTHTIRVTLREGIGFPGQDAFMKVQIDGIQKYFRGTGTIGTTFQQDYLKFATLYDYGKALVDPNNLTRGRKFSLATESFKVYEIK